MTNKIPHRELRNNSSAVLRRVKSGETFAVTNHGEVVAILAPPEQGVELRIVPASVTGGFLALTRVVVSERSEDALDDLRAG